MTLSALPKRSGGSLNLRGDFPRIARALRICSNRETEPALCSSRLGLAAEGAPLKRALLALAPAVAVLANVLLFYFYVGQYSAGVF